MRLISDRTTKELSQHHVQLLNTTFANIKQRLDCFNENTQKSLEKHWKDSKSVLQPAAKQDKINVENEFEVEGELVEAEEIANTVAWDNLADITKRRRLKEAARCMREQVLPFLRKWVHPMDDDGAPLSDNFLLSKVLRYGVRDARKMNRISSTLSFPEMLPNYVVDAITALARGEQPLRRLREKCDAGRGPARLARDQSAGTAVRGQRCGQFDGTEARPICRDSCVVNPPEQPRPIRRESSANNLPGKRCGQSAGTAVRSIRRDSCAANPAGQLAANPPGEQCGEQRRSQSGPQGQRCGSSCAANSI